MKAVKSFKNIIDINIFLYMLNYMEVKKASFRYIHVCITQIQLQNYACIN